MKTFWMLGTAALILSGASAWAQQFPVYESTGTIELTLDGKKSTYHTTSNTIPGHADKRIQTANWRVSAPMMMGGVNIAPPGILVSLSARPTVEPDPGSPELQITFSIDEDHHTLLKKPAFSVGYTHQEGTLAGTYQHASGTLQIDSVTPRDNDILEITGQAAGTLSKKGNSPGQSDKPLDYSADFTVQVHRH